MKKILITLLMVVTLITSSCNKWLDVRPEGEMTTPDLFSSYNGYASALNGCYFLLKNRNIYGENLTISHIESMGQLWRTDVNGRPADYELKNFNYDGDNAKTAVASIYDGLFNVIAQTNMIIKNLEETGDVITDPVSRALIEGESYAIRALCHFDILRLFGQVPGGSISVNLPFQEVVSHQILPKYFGYNDYVAKIEADLLKAESILKDKDPIFSYTFDYLNRFEISATDNIVLDDDFHGYRQHRMNYWAVKGLLARFYLYTGNKEKAYTYAKSILEAKGADGKDLIALSGVADINSNFLALPTESLFMLHVHNIITYIPALLGPGSIQTTNTHLVITPAQFNEMFDGQNIATNNRYKAIWNRTLSDPMGTFYPILMKFFYDKNAYSTAWTDMTKKQVMPMIRLSEIYLIAMETTPSLAEANSLWKKYQVSHNVLISGDAFSSLDQVKQEVLKEYRRELCGEGQIFFSYKRLNATSMQWRAEPVKESDYIVTLPRTEFNPNK